jgi:flavodoxin
MSKILVVVYSYTGTCRRLADLLCDQQGWPMAEITDAQPRRGALGTWRCLLDSWLRREPPIHYTGLPPDGFDAVVLIAPIWAYRLAGPMRSFVASRRTSLADVAVAPVMGGSGAPNAIAEVGTLIGRAPILSTAFTAREVEDGSCAARLRAFGDGVRTAKGADAATRPAIWSPQTA